jgi:hypothetical protein
MNSPAAASRGVVHVAYGARFVAEATVSARSVRATNPSLSLSLITDTPPAEAVWDDVQLVPNDGRGGSAMKLQMHRAPWAQSLFLDTDTLVVGDLAPVFTLLERFDLAGVQHSGGHHYALPGLPVTFPEFNSGVLAWRRTDAVLSFFSRWNERYDEYRDQQGRTWDQKSLRMALYESGLRLAALPHAYNLMPYFPSTVEGRAVILHGRERENLERLKHRLASDDRLRAYVPGLGVIRHPRECTWRETAALVARLILWRFR